MCIVVFWLWIALSEPSVQPVQPWSYHTITHFTICFWETLSIFLQIVARLRWFVCLFVFLEKATILQTYPIVQTYGEYRKFLSHVVHN